jgi:hypothetical protein
VFHHLIHIGLVGHVAYKDESVNGGIYLLQCLGGFFETLSAYVGECDFGAAFFDKDLRTCSSYT